MTDMKKVLAPYNVVWDTPSKNPAGSMPVGGGSVSCNAWVENGDLYLYMMQGGWFDEEGRTDKAGRLRVTLAPNPFGAQFRQELKLYDGVVEVEGEVAGKPVLVTIWADTARPVVELDVKSEVDVQVSVVFESWRLAYGRDHYPDACENPAADRFLTWHHNVTSKIFLDRVAEEGLEDIVDIFPDVQKNRTFGTLLEAPGMIPGGTTEGVYADTPFIGHRLETPNAVRSQVIRCYLHTAKVSVDEWKAQVGTIVTETAAAEATRRQESAQWWHNMWNRSYVEIDPAHADPENEDWQCGRNYQLFRYMLACNAHGDWPTKFNGGLFTVDPKFVKEVNFWGDDVGTVNCPDDRDWGGLIHTAQNQRWVYWPVIKNGDFEFLKPQLDYYERMLPGAKARTKKFHGIEDVACFPEQGDANGLSAFYGKDGMDFPIQVRNHFVEALEICYIAMLAHKVGGFDLKPYEDLILAVVNFYDKKYPDLDDRGYRILFPSTAMETYHGIDDERGKVPLEEFNYDDKECSVANPADLIAALDGMLGELLDSDLGDDAQHEKWKKFRAELPPIPTERKYHHTVVAPCEWPKAYKKTNCEIPQLNTVHPYNTYGINKPETLELARDTYRYAWDDIDQLQCKSWQNPGIYAARIGLVGDAWRYMRLKYRDSGRRFPAFWGPGWDYTPDHNWGGSGMALIQEMLMQDLDGKIYLLPAWPSELDVSFKLWASDKTPVEVSYVDGKLEYAVGNGREGDVVVALQK